jgi:Asp-tRNA(Asn)/Glu-tRNA(Gln) amidotransferase A subunit family amidase
LISEYDVVVAPSFGAQLVLTNLTGHPCLVMPNGFDEKGSPTSISFIGNMMGEAEIIALGELFQANTNFDDLHPELFNP